jgi:D-alanyl-D-alanine carboxypeptidase (penicillin-binding protein 5/6)
MKLTPLQIRLFLGTFIAIFAVVAMQKFGIRLERIISPIPDHQSAMDIINPKLLEKKNSFSLRKVQHLIPQAQAEKEEDYDKASAYVVMDYDTGEVIAEKNLSGRNPIASLTKVMSAVVTLDLVSPSREFTVAPRAASIEPTKIGVIPGQKLTVTELLEAALLTSANDAVEVLRDGVDSYYKEPIFVQAMNQKAKFVGLKNTSFANPQGFDNKDNYSSVEDLAILARYALTQYPLIAQIVKNDYLFLPENSSHKQYDLYNWNGLMDVYPNVSGVKIGNTDDAGMTTIVVSEREGKKLMVVLLGAPGIIERDLWASQLLDLGFMRTKGLAAINVTEEQLKDKYKSWHYWN